MSAGVPSDRWSDRLLARLGLAPRAFRALVEAFLLMDFRSQQFGRATATGANALLSPLFWVVGQYLMIGGFASVILFARVDAYFFALATIGVSMLVLATSIIVEFNEVVLDPGDLEIIAHRPVPVRTYSAARLTNLLGYVLLMSAALNVIPAIMGLGLRDTNWTFLPAYAAAALVGNLLAAGAIILLYTLIFKTVPGDSARETLAWTQIVLIMILFYGGQAMFRDPRGHVEMTAWNLPGWVGFLPPAWLARFVDSFDAPGPAAWWILAAVAALTVAVWAITAHTLSQAYAIMQAARSAWGRLTAPPLPAPGRLLGPVFGRLVRPGVPSACFWLCWTMLRRDADLRMRSWPSVGIVLAMLLLGLFAHQFGNPLAQPGAASTMSLVCLYLLAAPLPAVMSNLQYCRDHEATWVLACSPIANGDDLAEGARRAITWQIILPVFLLVIITFACIWRDPLSIALHAAAAWLTILIIGHLSKIGILRSYPLAAPLARGQTMGPIVLWSAIISGMAFILGGIHFAVVRSIPAFAIYLAGLAAITIAVSGISRRIMARRFSRGGAA